MPSDIFGLDLVYEKQVDRTWEESANYGYFAGGTPTIARLSTIDRLDFSNETVSAPGKNLTQARRYLTAVSNSNYGYFAGGDAPPSVSTIDRLDFTTEIITPTTNLPTGRGEISAVSSSNYGYITEDGYLSTIDRLDFSTETIDTPGQFQLSQGRTRLTSVSNSNYGYFGGGFSFPPSTSHSTIDRLDFSTETVTGPPIHGMVLTLERERFTAVSASDYGYFAGGQNSITVIYYNLIDRLDFSNETISTPGKNLPQTRAYQAAVSNSNYGYVGGGGLSPIVSSIARIDFSNETISSPASKLTESKFGLASVSGGSRINARKVRVGITTDNVPISSTYGYFGGGANPSNTPPNVSTIDRLDFSTETIQYPVINAKLPEARSGLAGVSNSNYGYFAGGFFTPPTTYVCTIDRLDFSNETVSAPGKNLTQARSGLAAVSNSNYGYFGGGIFVPPPTGRFCTIDRLDFSTETVTGPPIHGINLIHARNSFAAFSNSNYGYFGGGLFTSRITTIDRLDFSTETVTGPPIHGINLTEARSGLAGVSNSNYGYFAGGTTSDPISVNTIDRLDFSTETIQYPVINAKLLKKRSTSAGVSNSNYGYFGGGFFSPPTTYISDIDRLDFTTETVTIPAPTLTEAKGFLAAVSN